MADEAQLHVNLFINKDDGIVQYQSYPQVFIADVDGAKGPTPGSFTASVYGTAVDLSALTVPGLCWFRNQDPANYVTYGIEDPDTDSFFPLGEALAGEFFAIRLSRAIGQVWDAGGTGTGTSGTSDQRLMFYADTADCQVTVEAFEK